VALSKAQRIDMLTGIVGNLLPESLARTNLVLTEFGLEQVWDGSHCLSRRQLTNQTQTLRERKSCAHRHGRHDSGSEPCDG
jgi:hypothetical protein